MSILQFLLIDSIPDRPALWKEALDLISAGWGSIFIVTFIAMWSIFMLNLIFKGDK